jgi:DNA repair protein RadD
LCNVNVLTTGFDAPNVDCIALLRPTNSPGLLVQMIGRGFRLSPETGKKNCLILDYGENIMRHGPIDCIRIHEREKGNGKAPAKMCPECRALVHASYSICPECGFVFPVNNRNIKISPYASHDGVLSGQITYEEYEVLDVSYEIHHKRGDSSAPPTLQINYRVGLYQFKHEWVCPEHSGYARQKFEKWWYMRAAVGVLAPATVEEALSMARDGLLAEPKKIRVQIVSGEKYERIVKVELGERPRFTPVEADEEIPF